MRTAPLTDVVSFNPSSQIHHQGVAGNIVICHGFYVRFELGRKRVSVVAPTLKIYFNYVRGCLD